MKVHNLDEILADLKRRGMKVRKSRGVIYGKAGYVINGERYNIDQLMTWAYDYITTGQAPYFQVNKILKEKKISHMDFLEDKIENIELDKEIKIQLKDLHCMSLQQAQERLKIYAEFIELKKRDMDMLNTLYGH